MQDFTKLSVWQKAHDPALGVYRATDTFPKNERYELTRQMRGSATSIPTNIAEGCGRTTRGDFARFVTIAGGSASELEYQLRLSKDLGFLHLDAYHELTDRTREIKRMLSGLARTLRTEN